MKPARTPTCEHGNRHTKESLGGIHAVPGRMGPAAPALCVECPLRRDSTPGYLGGYSPEMYLEAMRSGVSIACHMSPGFNANDIATQRHCTGVAAFRANTGVVAMVDGHLTVAHESTVAIGNTSLVSFVFASEDDFVAHHKPGQGSNKGDES